MTQEKDQQQQQREKTNREKRHDEILQVFKQAYDKVKQKKISGYRRDDKSAWYSAQRDMVNLMPSMLSMACSIGNCTMPDEEQTSLGSLPRDLYAAAQGDRGGVSMIPGLVHDSFQNDEKATGDFMSCVGLSVLMTFAFIPAMSVNPDDTMEDWREDDVVLNAILSCLPSDMHSQVIDQLQDEEIITETMSDEMKQLTEKLRNLMLAESKDVQEEEEQEEKSNEQSQEDSESQ